MMEHVDYGFGFTARGWARIKQHMNVVSSPAAEDPRPSPYA